MQNNQSGQGLFVKYSLRLLKSMAYLALGIALFFVLSTQVHKLNNWHYSTPVTHNLGWYYETPGGIQYVVPPLNVKTNGDSFTIYHEIPAWLYRDYDMLILENHSQGIIASADGELVYSLNTEKTLSDIMMVDELCLISLPYNENSYILEITYTNLKDGICRLSPIQVGSSSDIYSMILSENKNAFFMLLILSVLLTCHFCILLFFSSKKIFDRRGIILFFLLLIVALWALNTSPLVALLPFSLEKLGILSLLSFSLTPMLVLQFVEITCGRNGWLTFAKFMAYVSVILQSINIPLKFLPMSVWGIVSDFMILLTITVSFGTSLAKWRKHKSPSAKYLYYAFLSLWIITTIPMLISRIYPYIPTTELIYLGVSIFVISLFFILLRDIGQTLLDNQKKAQQMTLYQQFAMYDSLTGLGNRRSFEKALKSIETSEITHDAILVMLDLNGLKYTNDNFGHRAGDDLLMAAANVLNSTYQNYGEVFRIGGDEFAVVITEVTKDIDEMDIEFQEEINYYNSQSAYRLSIARGASHLLTSAGNPLSISEWKRAADMLMYINKRAQHTNYPTEAEELREIIHSVISIVEAKDPYTASHSGRVAELSLLIAKKLGLTGQTIADIHSAAEMHDIGKIAISEAILLKPGRLTDIEFNSMKQHPVIGASIISKAESMREIAQIVRHHHERYDGEGYPDNLSSEDIPIGSRIIAIADSIDAMTSKRCYRDSLSLERCLQEIKNNLGIMYDPAIGHIVLESWDEIVDFIKSYESTYEPQQSIS